MRRPGKYLMRESDLREQEIRVVLRKRNRRVRQEEKRVLPVGALQRSQCAGGTWEQSSSSRARSCEKESSGHGCRPGGEWVLGVGLALANHSPRCSTIVPITSGSVMKEITSIPAPHPGQPKGSTSMKSSQSDSNGKRARFRRPSSRPGPEKPPVS